MAAPVKLTGKLKRPRGFVLRRHQFKLSGLGLALAQGGRRRSRFSRTDTDGVFQHLSSQWTHFTAKTDEQQLPGRISIPEPHRIFDGALDPTRRSAALGGWLRAAAALPLWRNAGAARGDGRDHCETGRARLHLLLPSPQYPTPAAAAAQLLLQPEPHRPPCARVRAQLEKALQRGGLEEEGGQNHWLSEVGWAKFMDEEAKSSCKPPRVEPGSLQCSALPTHSLHARSRR